MEKKELPANLNEREKELFDDWKGKYERKGQRFIEDGIVDHEKYAASDIRILVILKEVNDDKREKWKLKDHLTNSAPGTTWGNVARWVKGLQGIINDEEYEWSKLERIELERNELLSCISVMNIKKTPGGGTADDKALSDAAKEDKENLRKQIELYQPDIVICGGTGWLVKDIMEIEEWSSTSRGVSYNVDKNGAIVVDYIHPNAHVRGAMLYYTLIDAVREIREGQKRK